MIYPILGIVLAALDLYASLYRPSTQASPNAVTIGMPILIAAGILQRPTAERTSILVLAAMLGVWLNRVVIPQQAPVHLLVFAGALFLTWRAYRAPEAGRTADPRRLIVIVAVVLSAFALVWLWQLR